jgi:hypothetical protein
MVCSETVARMDAGPKPTGMYLRRASEQTIGSHVEPSAIHYGQRAARTLEYRVTTLLWDSYDAP